MIHSSNLLQLLDKLKTEQECIEYFIQSRWNGNPICPHCKHTKVYSFADKRNFKCKSCKRLFSYKTGSIFENTKVPMRKWFLAIYVHASHKKGISSYQLSKDIGVTQKTAWFMLQRIRHIMENGSHSPFNGITEMDEAYMGGSEANRHLADKKRTGPKTKTVVLGMVERNSKKVKAVKVESAKTYDLQDTIYSNITEGSHIVTDSYVGYDVLKWNYKHDTVNHSAGQYVKTDARVAFKIHTNAIEGYWSIVKRGINGIYHWCSKKHIQAYLNEFTFRYNERHVDDSEKFCLLLTQTETRLTYKQLIAA